MGRRGCLISRNPRLPRPLVSASHRPASEAIPAEGVMPVIRGESPSLGPQPFSRSKLQSAPALGHDLRQEAGQEPTLPVVAASIPTAQWHRRNLSSCIQHLRSSIVPPDAA